MTGTNRPNIQHTKCELQGFCSRPLFSVWHDTTHPKLWWGWVVAWFLSVVLAVGSRPVPFRTRKLSPPAPMVLHSGGCGRVGRRRHKKFIVVGRGSQFPCGVGCCGPLLFYPQVNRINSRFNATFFVRLLIPMWHASSSPF